MRFLNDASSFETSRFVILPVPFEATTSYVKGTRKAPVAILKASEQIEEFDEELEAETNQLYPVHTTNAVPLKDLGANVAKILKLGKIPVCIGGEHSISAKAVAAGKQAYQDLCVLQLDAHADLRDAYQGKKHSHACVMRRILEICPAVQVGIRNISKSEFEYAKTSNQIVKINPKDPVSQLSEHVYITIDADVFDPSIVPAVGTPEPGGMLWQEALSLLKSVCANKHVVGFDVVELCPRRGEIVSDFIIAKLIYKLMGFIVSAKK